MPGKTNFPARGLATVLTMQLFTFLLLFTGCTGPKETADAVYFNGKIVTVDSAFTITQAIAIKGEHILALGADREVLKYSGPQTKKVDLEGHTVVPGLIEAHAHPETASLSELEEPLPNPRTVGELLDWIRSEAAGKPAGAWIIHPKLFATRLRELRPPSLAELDSVAPANPVFLDGSFGGSVNSAAMRVSGITEKTEHPGLLRDPESGRHNGKIRFTAFALFKKPEPAPLSTEKFAEALCNMFARYNRVGFTSFASGALLPGETRVYDHLKEQNLLTIRAFLNIQVPFEFQGLALEEIRKEIAGLGPHTGAGDEWVRIGALKTILDGGILTGTAFLSEPWGPKAREIFGVVDPEYRGFARATAEQFASLVQAGAEAGWKMTAHATGGGTVELMLEGYEQANRSVPIPPLRCSIIHGNFFTPETIDRMKALNIIADLQPAWFYKDSDALLYILGPDRVRPFHPYRSLIDGGVRISAGSDHMVILDDKESINPYSPWLGMWTMVTRTTERGTAVFPEEAITREEALRCYTINNAYASFEEQLKGSLEPGKLADLAVLDEDYLTCPAERIKDIQVRLTMVGGRVVYQK